MGKRLIIVFILVFTEAVTMAQRSGIAKDSATNSTPNEKTFRLTDKQIAAWDSALSNFRQLEKLSEYIRQQTGGSKSLCQIGTYYLQRNDLLRGKKCFMQVIEASRKVGDKAGEARVWISMGISIPYADTYFPDILICYHHALDLAGQLHNQQQQALLFSAIGEVQFVEGKLKEAERELLQAVSIQKAIGYKEIYNTYYTLADINVFKGYFNRALLYALETVKSVEAVHATNELDFAYFRLGYVYFQLGNINKCITAFRKSLAISRKKEQVIVDGSLAKTMARALLKQGKPQEALLFLQYISRKNLPFRPQEKSVIAESIGECYTAMHQYKQAETYYKKSMEAAKQGAKWDVLVACAGISRFYIATAQYTKADACLNQLLAAPAGLVPLNILMEVHWMGFKADSAAGNYLSAIAHFRQHKALSDSIFSASRSRQLEELQMQYEISNKEQQIQLLTAKGQRQQSELKQEQITRNSFIAGAILLAGLLGIGFNRYRLKQKSNQQLQVQQAEITYKNEALRDLVAEKEWLLKEIHHRVKNNLQIITSLLHSQGMYLTDQAAVSAIRESQNRVHAMALLHQKLYQSERIATTITMADYIEEIVDYLISSFNRQNTIQKRITIASVELDVTYAVPLGLIINEAITNSLKYGFPAHQPGTVTVRLTPLDSLTYQLTVSDDGVGLPADFNPSKSRSLGMSLIRGLSKQIGGRLRIYQREDKGVEMQLEFVENSTKSLVSV